MPMSRDEQARNISNMAVAQGVSAHAAIAIGDQVRRGELSYNDGLNAARRAARAARSGGKLSSGQQGDPFEERVQQLAASGQRQGVPRAEAERIAGRFRSGELTYTGALALMRHAAPAQHTAAADQEAEGLAASIVGLARCTHSIEMKPATMTAANREVEA